jgi:predicted amidohydrolase
VSWKIGATQLEDIQNDIPAALAAIKDSMQKADEQKIEILCFPECFLQGYTLDLQETRERALNLESSEMKVILDQLADFKAAAILGLIEEDGGDYFNTAVVIQNGKLLGKYRKVHLFEENFKSGEEYPVFTVSGITFGINICYDARFTEGAAELAAQGAKVIFYPLNNRLPTEKAVKYRDKHTPNLIDRAKEAGCWVVSSDVVHESEDYMGYGCTAIVSPEGRVVDEVTQLQTGLIVIAL